MVCDMEELDTAIQAQAAFALSLRWQDLRRDVIRQARWILLDSIGCMIEGRYANRDAVNLIDNGDPMSDSMRLINLTRNMMCTELYEGNRFAKGHPAAHIIPMLVLETMNGSFPDDRELLTTLVASYEVASRWGRSLTINRESLGHGMTLNAGPATVCGRARRLDMKQFHQGLLMACALPQVSVWRSVFEGSQLHDAYAALGAFNAATAMMLAQGNATGSDRIVDEVWHTMLGGDLDEKQLSYDLGHDWLITRNYFKVHSGCRFISMYADILADEMSRGLKADQVESIDIWAYAKASRLSGKRAVNPLAAQFSIPVSLAVLMIGGSLDLMTLNRFVGTPEVNRLAAAITVMNDLKYDAFLPDIRAGEIIIRLTNGTAIQREVFHAIGDYDNPEHAFTIDDLQAKFIRQTGSLSDELRNHIIDTILSLGAEEGEKRLEGLLRDFKVFSLLT